VCLFYASTSSIFSSKITFVLAFVSFSAKYYKPIGASPLCQEGSPKTLQKLRRRWDFYVRAVLAPPVIAKPVLVRLRHRVAQIEEKHKAKLDVWSYLQRHVREKLENAAPPGLPVAEHDVVNPSCLCQFLSDCGV
jgi:hypothetical protein